jgi:hypothetical protein
VFRDVYIRRDVELTAAITARAAWLSTGAVLAGISAAAALGTKWLDPAAIAEIVRADRHAQPGMVAHSYRLDDGEVGAVRGMRVTTPARTAFDIGRRLPAARAVPILDALLNATGIKPPDVVVVADRHAGARGIRRLRAALELTDGGAESPQETRVRLLLVGAGLPKPETQIEFPDCASAWTWGGANGRSPSSTTVSSTGTTASSGRGTSSASPCWKRPAGRWSGSVRRCCRGRR